MDWRAPPDVLTTAPEKEATYAPPATADQVATAIGRGWQLASGPLTTMTTAKGGEWQLALGSISVSSPVHDQCGEAGDDVVGDTSTSALVVATAST